VFGNVLKLTLCSLVFWGLAAYPAYLLAGCSGVFGSAAAMTLCALPAAFTLILHEIASRRGAGGALAGMLGGMFVRVSFVLGFGTLLVRKFASFDPKSFLIWLMIFYLVTLAAEVYILVRGIKLREFDSRVRSRGSRIGQVASNESVGRGDAMGEHRH